MEKKILFDQLDDRIRKVIALLIYLYPRLVAHELQEEEIKGMFELVDGLSVFLKTIYDVEYLGNIQAYKQDILNIARNSKHE